MRCLLSILLLSFAFTAWAEPLSFKFAERDTCDLYLDVYLPDKPMEAKVCVLYAYGGGFREGSRLQKHTTDFMQRLADEGVVAVAMDYRLGFKGNVSELKVMDMVSKFAGAVNAATEDMFSALRFVYDHCEEWGADKSKIVLAGSSAGAITALQCDFAISNGLELAKIMPEGYKPAGVISCSGAVCIFEGKLKYPNPPSPTMFLHGTEDELVNYNKFVVFGKGMYGSKHLAKLFDKKGFPYYIMRFEHFGHEISAIPQIENLPEMMRFIDLFVVQGKDMKIDQSISEKDVTSPLMNVTLRSYQNPNNKLDVSRYIERVNK